MSVKPPVRCVSCGGKEFTAPRDIHGYVPATFGWFGDPLVGFACADCGYVALFLKPRKRVSDRMVGGKDRDAEDAGTDDGKTEEDA